MELRVLVAEDEEIARRHLVNTFEKEGFKVLSAPDGLEAWRLFEAGEPDLIVADVRMPGMTGLELLAKVKETRPDTDVIVITAYGSIDMAVDAMKAGAIDYVTKPLELDELVLKVKKALERKELKKENLALRAFAGPDRKLSVVAQSQGMKDILSLVEGLKDSSCSVLLTGESGVGKNLIAKIIHYSSRRKGMPFLSINCATFTEELLASELFGHEKGAFTGAVKTKQGLAEIADTGTLSLDEIAEMSPGLQAKLLKLIEEGEFYRVGGTKPIRVNVRFMAATNQDVKASVASGRFREDLYYRLNVMEIFIPPLRERKDDIIPLARFFLDRHLPKSRKKIKDFAKETLSVLKSYSFPGNVRELENIVERAIILEKSELITPESLPQSLSMFQIETVEHGRVKTIDELNRNYAEKVVEMFGGNRTKAADMLGISRTSLWRLLKEE